MSDEELALLSDGASAALTAFFEQQCTFRGSEERNPFDENWNLSQFWYTDETADVICQEVEKVLGENARVACISCPTIFRQFIKRESLVKRTLFEFDPRFSVLGDFVHYDYNMPANVDQSLCHAFDAVIVDPPYLSEECLVKTLRTVKMLARSETETRIYLLTGLVMKDVAFREASLKPVMFRPQHQSKLGNDFRLYTNHQPTHLLGDFEVQE